MRISEMAKMTDLSASKLRYYEKKQLIKVKRDENGRRVYDENDVEWVKFICRLKDTGMILKDIQKYAKLRYAGESTMAERLEMLRAHREYVLKQQLKWQEYLENLDAKIEFYKAAIGD